MDLFTKGRFEGVSFAFVEAQSPGSRSIFVETGVCPIFTPFAQRSAINIPGTK